MPKKKDDSFPHGIGAVSEVRLKFLHPQTLVRTFYTKYRLNAIILGFIELRREKKQMKDEERWCIVFHHNDFPNKELYCCEKWAQVVKAPDTPFQLTTAPTVLLPASANDSVLLGEQFNDGNRFVQEGFMVNDDNLLRI